MIAPHRERRALRALVGSLALLATTTTAWAAAPAPVSPTLVRPAVISPAPVATAAVDPAPTDPTPVAPAALATAANDDVELVGDVPYEVQATRAETLEHMLSQLERPRGDWSQVYLASPFPYAGHGTGDLAAAHAPEQWLADMAVDGPGPDLDAVMQGKTGIDVRWDPLGHVTDRKIDLNVFDDPELHDEASCYLYMSVTSDVPLSLPVTMGSDDGLRFWLNGELLLHVDEARGMTPDSEKITLALAAGTNHVLVKISEGSGDWAYQINTRERLDSLVDAKLHYLIDRDFPPSPERACYDVYTYPLPDDLVLEVGGLAHRDDGRPVVTTRRGDVYLVNDAYDEPPFGVGFQLYASGLHEPLGAAVRDGAIYTVQRGELTRLTGRETASYYETFSDGWGVSGNYHEFAFGPKFDQDGNAWVTLNVGFCGSLGKSLVPWRGWALKITPEREVIPVADGLRSPNGIAILPNGEVFYVDNQGDYVGTNRLSHLIPGSWHGHPATLRWREDLEGFELPAGFLAELAQHDDEAVDGAALNADEPTFDETQAGTDETADGALPRAAGVDVYAATHNRPARQPPAVWFPYKKMGQSVADIAVDETGGNFGPFAGQLFVGDQTLATVMRVFLEQVDGHYQGACFPFLQALDCGVNRLHFLPDGSLLVGQTDRGWASVGRRTYGLQRVRWNGEVPFDILSMEATNDGFVLTFTDDVDPASAADRASYSMLSYTYEYHAAYGAPEDDSQELQIVSASVQGPRQVRLVISPLKADYVHELSADGVRLARDTAVGLLHDTAYYTLVKIPAGDDAR